MFSKISFRKKDPFLQFLKNVVQLKSISRFSWYLYKYKRRNAKCIGIFKIYVKDSLNNLYVVLRVYRGYGWPIHYAAKWSFGDDTTRDGLLNVSHNSPPMIGKQDFIRFVKQLTASIHGVRTMHSFYRFNDKLPYDSIYEDKVISDKSAVDR